MYKKRGFTLIELLIVIALLGALAVGLLAALDPFEQLKKGTDTGVRNTTSEFQGAVVRYYAIKNYMPWSGVTSLGPVDMASGYTTLSVGGIVTAGELKADFSTLAAGQLAKITVVGTDQSVTACFRPESKSFRSDPNTKYNASGVEYAGGNTEANCGLPSNNAFSCYWCVR